MSTDQLLDKLKVSIAKSLDDPEITPRDLAQLGELILDLCRFESISTPIKPLATLPALPFTLGI